MLGEDVHLAAAEREHAIALGVGSLHAGRADRHAGHGQARDGRLLLEHSPHVLRGNVSLDDVAIDQGGCFETSKATTHADPIYEVDGIMHYCVANMPGAVGRTSTYALTNATLPYARRIADHGIMEAARRWPELQPGVSVRKGRVTHPEVAKTFGYKASSWDDGGLSYGN